MNKELTIIEAEGKEIPVLDSREVAEMLGKEHKQLLKDIEGNGKTVGIIPILLGENFSLSNYFIKSCYKDRSGKTNKSYLITKMGCELLGNKQQGAKGIIFSAKYVERFNKYEEALKEMVKPQLPTDYLSALKALVASEEERVKLTQEVAIMKPKANYFDKVMDSEGLLNINQIAKVYGMSAIKFNLLLKDLKIQYKQNGQWLLYSKYHDKGYTRNTVYPFVDSEGKERAKSTTKWTQKGAYFLYDVLEKENILPIS